VQQSFSISCSSLETSGLTSEGKTSETSSSEKVTRRRLKLEGFASDTQFSSGETNRSGCSGDSGGERRQFEDRCSISSSESMTVLIESKLRLLEIWVCTKSSSFAVLPREFNRVLCSTIAERMGVGGIAEETMFTVGTGHSLISSRSKEKDFNMKEGAPGPPNRTMDPLRTRVGTTTLLSLGVEVTRTPLM